MNTIFRKLYSFAKEYPSYGLEISIKTIPDECDLDVIDSFYQKMINSASGLTQVISNPKYQVAQIREAARQKDDIKKGVAESSKGIKKDKSQIQIKKLKMQKTIQGRSAPKVDQKAAQNNPTLEEGEEDPNAENNMFMMDQMQFEIDEKPQDVLLEEHPKFPLYIEIRIS